MGYGGGGPYVFSSVRAPSAPIFLRFGRFCAFGTVYKCIFERFTRIMRLFFCFLYICEEEEEEGKGYERGEGGGGATSNEGDLISFSNDTSCYFKD